MIPTREMPGAVRRRALHRRRLVALGLLAVVIGSGLGVHALLPDTHASDIAGDALYTAAVYLGVLLVAPMVPPFAVGAITAAWCVGVELFQLTGIPVALGAVFPPSMLVLGTVFDARDLGVYVLTAAVLAAVDTILRRRASNAP